MANITDYLPAETMRKLESLSIRSRYVAQGAQSGAHRSKLKGQSVEFADRREYVKGEGLAVRLGRRQRGAIEVGRVVAVVESAHNGEFVVLNRGTRNALQHVARVAVGRAANGF